MPRSDMMHRLEECARRDPKRVALPESDDERVLRLAEKLVAEAFGTPVLVGNAEAIRACAADLRVSTEGFDFFDPSDASAQADLVERYGRAKGEYGEKFVLRKMKQPLACAMLLVRAGIADCVAAGRACSTGEVILAAQGILGLAEGISGVSSLGVVNAPGFAFSEGAMFAIADCAINAEPDAGELSDIAIASADTVNALLGWEPRVAMLSFSTCGSAEHASIDVIREAVQLAKSRRPSLKIDGEFQLDAALLPEIAARKVSRESEVAGRANVLIFPNLHAGNIGVKLIQLFGRADAYGPILQGFQYPVCDFSRSAPLSEMLGNVVMLIVRAQSMSKEVVL